MYISTSGSVKVRDMLTHQGRHRNCDLQPSIPRIVLPDDVGGQCLLLDSWLDETKSDTGRPLNTLSVYEATSQWKWIRLYNRQTWLSSKLSFSYDFIPDSKCLYWLKTRPQGNPSPDLLGQQDARKVFIVGQYETLSHWSDRKFKSRQLILVHKKWRHKFVIHNVITWKMKNCLNAQWNIKSNPLHATGFEPDESCFHRPLADTWRVRKHEGSDKDSVAGWLGLTPRLQGISPQCWVGCLRDRRSVHT